MLCLHPPPHSLCTGSYVDCVAVLDQRSLPSCAPPAPAARYAEKRDPNLAVIAYKRGQCDDALIECTSKNALFKPQARCAQAHMHHALIDEVDAHEQRLPSVSQARRMLTQRTLPLPLLHTPSRYIVERADPALWHKVLDEANPHRASLIEQVVGTALPESRNPEQVRREDAGQSAGRRETRGAQGVMEGVGVGLPDVLASSSEHRVEG